MKQFKFIGNPSNWEWEPKLISGKVYPADYSGYEHDGKKVTVKDAASKDFCMKGFEDWKEVSHEN